MNDNDIIVALECCKQKSFKRNMCAKCPLFHENCYGGELLKPHVFKLINRQKAEIERLKRYDEERDIRLHARLTETARVEAIKEFAERLKQTRVDLDGIEMVAVGNIDSISKEMTEE